MKTLDAVNEFLTRLTQGQLPLEQIVAVILGGLLLCGLLWWLLPGASAPTEPAQRTPWVRPGLVLIIIGLAGAAYFALFFDVSVAIGSGYVGRVANLDLMSQRQNGLIVSIAALLLGAIWQLGSALKRGK